jgi:hypothetical protein
MAYVCIQGDCVLLDASQFSCRCLNVPWGKLTAKRQAEGQRKGREWSGSMKSRGGNVGAYSLSESRLDSPLRECFHVRKEADSEIAENILFAAFPTHTLLEFIGPKRENPALLHSLVVGQPSMKYRFTSSSGSS